MAKELRLPPQREKLDTTIVSPESESPLRAQSSIPDITYVMGASIPGLEEVMMKTLRIAPRMHGVLEDVVYGQHIPLPEAKIAESVEDDLSQALQVGRPGYLMRKLEEGLKTVTANKDREYVRSVHGSLYLPEMVTQYGEFSNHRLLNLSPNAIRAQAAVLLPGYLQALHDGLESPDAEPELPVRIPFTAELNGDSYLRTRRRAAGRDTALMTGLTSVSGVIQSSYQLYQTALEEYIDPSNPFIADYRNYLKGYFSRVQRYSVFLDEISRALFDSRHADHETVRSHIMRSYEKSKVVGNLVPMLVTRNSPRANIRFSRQATENPEVSKLYSLATAWSQKVENEVHESEMESELVTAIRMTDGHFEATDDPGVDLETLVEDMKIATRALLQKKGVKQINFELDGNTGQNGYEELLYVRTKDKEEMIVGYMLAYSDEEEPHVLGIHLGAGENTVDWNMIIDPLDPSVHDISRRVLLRTRDCMRKMYDTHEEHMVTDKTKHTPTRRPAVKPHPRSDVGDEKRRAKHDRGVNPVDIRKRMEPFDELVLVTNVHRETVKPLGNIEEVNKYISSIPDAAERDRALRGLHTYLTRGIGLRKLRGANTGLYRLRLGSFRMVLREQDGILEFVSMERRDSRTYSRVHEL